MRRTLFGAVLTGLAALSLIGTDVALGTSSSTAAPSTAITVTGSGQSGWNSFQQCYDSMTGDPTTSVDPSNTVRFVPGPATPPLGAGSLRLTTGNGSTAGDCQAALRNSDYAGTKLSALTSLSYYTNVSENNGDQFPVLSLSVNNDGTGTTVDDTLFFEPPYQQPTTGDPVVSPLPGGCPDQGATAMNTWQNWNALTGCWWDNNGFLGSGGLGSVNPLSTYLATYPDATIVNPASNEGGVRFFVGEASPSDQFVGNVDDAVIGTSSATNTYNFEPANPIYVAPGASNTNTNTSCQDADYSNISSAIADAAPGVTIDVCPGTYQEYVTIPSSLTGLTIKGISSQSGNQPVIVFPTTTTGNPQASTLNADPLLTVDGATGVTIQNLHISGPYYTTGCQSYTATHYGVYVGGAGGSATIENDNVSEIRAAPSENLNGCQDGVGIGVGNGASSPPDHGTATIESDVIENYQKDGILVDGGASDVSSAPEITNNVISGIGPTSVIGSNGIEVDDSSTATIANNHVSGNQYTPPAYQGSGILLYSPGAVSVSSNTLSANDIGIYAYDPSAAVTVGQNSVTNDTTNADSEGIQLDDVSGGSVTGNTVSGGYVGIDVFDGTTGATIQSNTVTGATFDGILDQSTTPETTSSTYSSPPAATGNTFLSDSASGSGTYDCQDFTTGTGTAMTNNTWKSNVGAKANPTGICSTTGTLLYSVNAGGPAISGTPNWGADTSSSPSSSSNATSSGNNWTYATSTAINTNSTGVPASVFQTCRWSAKTSPDLTWSFPVTSGTNVTVKLDFAEIYPTLFHNGARVFNVYIDGTEKLTNFDIYKTAGAGDKGVVESFPVTSTGTVTITFQHVTQNPEINGIQIVTS
jgi:parallel beta-helix repeat protein